MGKEKKEMGIEEPCQQYTNEGKKEKEEKESGRKEVEEGGNGRPLEVEATERVGLIVLCLFISHLSSILNKRTNIHIPKEERERESL